MKKARILFVIALALLSLAFVSCGSANVAGAKYKVDFIVDGELYRTVDTDGKNISMPIAPCKDGYIFKGWYADNDAWEKDFDVAGLAEQPLSEDTRLKVYARFMKMECTVRFVSGTDEVIEPQVLASGEFVDMVTLGDNGDMALEGWYKDAALTQKWVFDTDTVIEDVTLCAKWSGEIVNITYDFNWREFPPMILQNGKNILLVEPSVSALPLGMYFDGWYKDVALTQKWDFGRDIVTESITLYAKWQGEQRWLTLIQKDNGACYIKVVHVGEKIKPFTDIIAMEWQTLDGYFKDSACSQRWNFDTDIVSGDFTLYIKYNFSQCVVSYNTKAEIGYDLPSDTVDCNSYIKLRTFCKDGKTIKNWRGDDGKEYNEGINGIRYDIVLTPIMDYVPWQPYP